MIEISYGGAAIFGFCIFASGLIVGWRIGWARGWRDGWKEKR